MTAITIRNLSPAVARALRERAVRDGVSMSRAVVSLLEEATGRKRLRGAAHVHHELDALAGAWSREESVEFERALREQRMAGK